MLGVLKPPGMTSHDVVSTCRRIFRMRAVGHTGTLDPLAAGVLPVLFGRATRLADYLAWPAKQYRAEIVFGLESDTGDLDGQVSAQQAPPPAPARPAVLAALGELVGRQRQVPPAYSARKVGGRKLYDLARAGEISAGQLELAAREVTVYSVELAGQATLGWGAYASYPGVLVDITCSSGTYVRQLAARLGELLGLPACLGFLLRRQCGGIGLSDCVSMEQLTSPSGLPPELRFEGCWFGASATVGFLPQFSVSANDAARLANGVAIDPVGLSPRAAGLGRTARAGPLSDEAAGWLAIVGPRGELIALADGGASVPPSGRLLRPRKVFAR